MKDGVAGGPINNSWCGGFGKIANLAGIETDCAPALLGAIAWRETLIEMDPLDATGYISGDNGHGIMQLTSVWPVDWNYPLSNVRYAANRYVTPAWEYWASTGLVGDDLVKLIACEYNAGRSATQVAHDAGDADQATTGHNYGSAVVGYYKTLAATGELP